MVEVRRRALYIQTAGICRRIRECESAPRARNGATLSPREATMKKMRLEIDNLTVESFDVSERSGRPGTVYGHYPTRGDCTGEGCQGSGFPYSCDVTHCDNQSCVVLCPYTYYCQEMTNNTCAYTCSPCNPTAQEAGTCNQTC